MSQSPTINRRIVLASRPYGVPTLNDFRLEQQPIPVPGTGELLLRNVYLSLDPYVRGRMSDAPSYSPPMEINDVIVGGSVSKVVQSNHPEFQTGDWVVSQAGWQDYMVTDGQDIIKLDSMIPHPSYALGILGMPGFTAYMGLLDIGQPKAGETLVVAAATGPVGGTVGQIAKLKGCRVIGIAGSAEKCRYAVETLGFDLCLDHYQPDLAHQLANACPQGIDIYYENVGGKVFDAVLPLLNARARIPVCGIISQYNATALPDGPDRLGLLESIILKKRIRMQGFIIFNDYAHHFGEFIQQMGQWVAEGKIKYREHLVQGLENAPDAFIGLLKGENFGKLIIQLGDEN
ncbi:NADP-dependent oxidoreductase [Jinshanibacter sp. LJY008]|uniref:NADP-dependent oxidoreductase n=1 Tax=Limnobaculum eriocheiris TaxID=2897391 RepID=A0A9X1MWL8_9GAMM|nr:NADP-dependent oxidoreductase [Limnobaculum eriocheiris]MCD1127066.1 NADP-dependent oxidoreductase [Limnobaculum eriocheiris]